MVWVFFKLHEAAISLHLQSLHSVLVPSPWNFRCSLSDVFLRVLPLLPNTSGIGTTATHTQRMFLLGVWCWMQILHDQSTAVFGFCDVLQFDLAWSAGWSREPDSDLRPNLDFVFQLPNFIMVWQSCALTCSCHEENTCDLLEKRLLLL